MTNTTNNLDPQRNKPTAHAAAAPAPNPAQIAAPPPAKPKTEAMVRDARLKAALKANMARRKGQAQARAVPKTSPSGNDINE